MLQTRPRVKPGRPPLVASLTLLINGPVYHVSPIRGIEDPDVSRAWRLEKHGDPEAVYDVAATVRGLECSCPDWHVRRAGLDASGCKHVKALVAVGLLEAVAPVGPVAPVLPARPIRPRPTTDDSAGLSCPIDSRPLPTIFGVGLEAHELNRVNGAHNRAYAAYAKDCPDATVQDLERVAKAAATDELRRTLARRPTAPPPACCSPSDPAPCLACAPIAGDPFPPDRLDPDDCPSDPELWGPEWDEDVWTLGPDPDDDEPAPLLTLEQFIGQEAARFRRMEHAAGDLLARTLEGLAETARLVRAMTPADLVVRMEALGDREPIGEPEPELLPSGRWA